MKKLMKKLCALMCVFAMVMSVGVTAFAHSGRTDGSGGHKDNKNKSGLGGYHYHCGGYPAHLHEDGYCPYTDVLPQSVSMKVKSTTLHIGDESTISATVSPSNAVDTSVYWSTSDSSVVTVDDGEIKAVGYGTAVITATSFNGKSNSVKITVKEITADSIEIQEKVETMRIGTKQQLSAVIKPDNVENTTITWSSSDKSVIKVSKDGKIEAVDYGTAKITAKTSNGKTSSRTIEVIEVCAEEVTIQEEIDSMHLEEECQLTAVITPEDVDDPTLVWKSSDESIATVDQDGNVKAIALGTVEISVEASNGVSDSREITVNEIVAEKIEIDVDTTVIHGDSLQAEVIFYPENTTVQDITWEIDNSELASIDENGKITSKNVGTITVTAIQKDVSTSCKIEILPRAVESIEIISPIENGLDKGETAQLTAIVTPDNATYPEVYWESSDPEVLSIDENGNVEAISWGTVTITAYTQDGCSATCEITVLMSTAAALAILAGMAAVVGGGITLIVKKIKKMIRKKKAGNE